MTMEIKPEGGGPDVFVYGYYGCGNLGDEMLLSAVASGILERWPGARFRVRNLGPIAPERRLGGRIRATGIERILLEPGRGRIGKAVAYLRAAEREMRGCRCFVLGGGTLIHAKTSIASLALLTALIVIARMRGLAVVGLGLGANHLDTPVARGLTRTIRALTSDLVVRDEPSREVLGGANGCRLAADLVYSWWPAEIGKKAMGQKPVIAVTLWSTPPPGEAALIEAIAGALAVEARKGFGVRCLVFQDGDAQSGGFSDRGAIGRLAARLARDDVVCEVVRPGAEPADLARAFDDVAVHWGARFHASVAATLLGVPTVGLATDSKVSSLCDEFGLPWLAPEGVDQRRLSEAIETAKVRVIDDVVLEDLRRRSGLNFDWFAANASGRAAQSNGSVGGMA